LQFSHFLGSLHGSGIVYDRDVLLPGGMHDGHEAQALGAALRALNFPRR